MTMPARVIVPSLVLACLPAQQQSRGPLAGAATAILVDGGLAAGLDAQTRVHRNGFNAGATLPLPAGQNLPDLREILQGFFPAGWPATLDFDDFSLGRDDVLIDENGVVDVPPSSWGVLSFSLRQGALGEPGYAIANEAAAGSIGAALFSYILPGSALPAQLVGARAELSHSRRDLGLPIGAEVDGLDFPLMLGRDQDQAALGVIEPGFQTPVGTFETIYFTVSSSSLSVVPASWWMPFTTATAASGATILRITRQSPTAPWQPPQVWKRWADLGLSQSEDIDALAVNDAEEKVLFSCTGTVRDQFLFADFGTDGGPPPPLTVMANGQPVSTNVGKLQNDDVDAVCTLDPHIGSSGSPPAGFDDFGSSCGSPRVGWLGVPSVHASAFRRREAGATFFDTWMVGWPPATGVTAGIALLFVTLGDDVTLIPYGPIHLRNTADPTPGNPCADALPIPAAFSLTGTRLTFRWVAIAANFAEIAEALPVQICL